MLKPAEEQHVGNIICLRFVSPSDECKFDTNYPITYDSVSCVTLGGIRQPPGISFTIEKSSVCFDKNVPKGIPVIIEIMKDKIKNYENARKIFIVHGHDETVRQTVARFLEKIDLQPTILHEQINSGLTIIEKFEKNADVAFAVVLMTPDDVGGKDNGSLKPRARQNVVAELGYFIGRLGRNKVAALVKGDVEIPSDFDGVVYTPLDDYGAWKTKLANELEGAGLEIDFQKVAKA